MEIFEALINGIGLVPDCLPLVILPLAVIAVAVLFTTLGGRKFYGFITAVLGGVGFVLVACKGDLTAAFIWLALYAVLAALLSLLFLIPCPMQNRKGKDGQTARDRKIYEKFRSVLDEAEEDPLPPKVVCYEEEEPPVTATAEESGMQLAHVKELIAALRKEKLSPPDRLETDVLSRTVEAFGAKPLSEEELGTLNDCLASVLKLTAKYKL